MGLGALRALTLDRSLAIFGVPVTVTPLDKSPITTRGIWLTPSTEGVPPDAGYQRFEQKRIMAIGKSDVPILVKGSRIRAPEKEGGTIKRWVVDAHDFSDNEHHRVVVAEVEY